MARRARLQRAGGVFHVVSRFARDEWWLDRPGARAAYLDLVGRAAASTDTSVLAYCLMSNHVHLVLLQGKRPLSRFLKSVHTGFAVWARRSVGARRALGPVFAERPHEVLVDEATYLTEVVRYVHNNPVRAGLVRRARHSAWSSHQAYIGRVRAPAWLRMGHVLERFDEDPRVAVAKFEAYVDAGRKDARRPELSGAGDVGEAAAARRAVGDGYRVSDGILGDESFVEHVRKDAERMASLLSKRETWRREGAAARPTARVVIDGVLALMNIDEMELIERPKARHVTHAKRLATWVWVHEYQGKQIDLARVLSINTSKVSEYYAQAMAMAADMDVQGAAVVALLRQRRSERTATPRTAMSDALPVRYHIDVDET